MAKKKSLKLPVGPLPDLVAWLRKAKVRSAIIGGLAVAFRGRPRMTRDIDLLVLVQEKRWPAFLAQAKEFAFRARVEDALDLARATRVLLLHHEPSGVDVDLILAGIPYEERILARSKKVKVGSVTAPVATAEDLIVLKAIAYRPIDQQDIRGLLDAGTRLDYDYVRTHLRRFAEILEMPELAEVLEPMLLAHENAHRRKRK